MGWDFPIGNAFSSVPHSQSSVELLLPAGPRTGKVRLCLKHISTHRASTPPCGFSFWVVTLCFLASKQISTNAILVRAFTAVLSLASVSTISAAMSVAVCQATLAMEELVAVSFRKDLNEPLLLNKCLSPSDVWVLTQKKSRNHFACGSLLLCKSSFLRENQTQNWQKQLQIDGSN